MLKSISCEALLKTPLNFNEGLNSVVGANDAKNSIGKSSVLMLIDFALGGTDFPKKCDDVTRNVGHLDVGIEFEFNDKRYSFIRKTEDVDYVYSIDDTEILALSEYNNFLKNQFLGEEALLTFRACVSGFFRVYQRNNYNDRKPFDIVAKEGWKDVRVRLVKLFNKYNTIDELLKEQKQLKQTGSDITGAFNSGAVKKISKRQFDKNENSLVTLNSESEQIKLSLQEKVTSIHSIINERSRDLKKEKDLLVNKLNTIESQLTRIDNNLSGQKVRSNKTYQDVLSFFPGIDETRLEKVESFHSGISKILKSKLNDEKSLLLDSKLLVEEDIAEIDNRLAAVVGSKDESRYLLERLIELDREIQTATIQNEFYDLDKDTKQDVKSNKEKVSSSFETALSDIARDLNNLISSYIQRIYTDNPISPKLEFKSSDYALTHGDDRGTGKGFGNLISLDLAVLEQTYLPCLIHDSVLFKNLDVPAVENLISVYSSFEKQIFIAIDEVPKYSKVTQNIIKRSEFIKLSQDKLAFKKSWKTSSDQPKEDSF